MVEPSEVTPRRVTALLAQAHTGDLGALDALWPIVYDELRSVARAMLARQRGNGHTLQPTALVNDAYLKLLGVEGRFEGAAHFRAVAAKAMRQVLQDHARGRSRQKRGGDGAWQRVTLADVDGAESGKDLELIALDEALTELSGARPEYGDIVEMRFFAGMSLQEIADVTGVSLSTVKSRWRTARAWLRARVEDE